MRRAVVTGCSRGIGRAVTEMLLVEGWRVTGVSRTRPDYTAPRFLWWPADIGTSPNLLPDTAKPLDALIHCAAIRRHGLLSASDPDAWVDVVTTNLIGTYRVIRAALPSLHCSEDGRILLFSGGGAFDASPNYSAYGCSKAGVVALMETLAEELRDTTVTVNCVAPGYVATSIHDGTPDAGRPEREGAMGDVVACVRHLLSPATHGLSGRTVAAQYDDWTHLTQMTIPALMQTAMGTRFRHTIEQCQRLLRQAI